MPDAWILPTFQRPSPGRLNLLAYELGVPVAALSLLLSILATYPIAGIYRRYLYRSNNERLHHLYFVITGFLLIVFNYGLDVIHSLIAIGATHILIRLFLTRPTLLAALNFSFHMGYLLCGYYFTESGEYDIIWTMPHCVLVLRLIGLVFNLCDGQEEDDRTLSKEQMQNMIIEPPSLLEIAGFTYFPACCLIGPQFNFSRYRRFLFKEFHQMRGSIKAGFKRLGLGIFYLAVREMIKPAYGGDEIFLKSEMITEFNLLGQCILLAIWGHMVLYKYVGCWLLAEGAAIIMGISYDGTDDWAALSNIHVLTFEKATKLGDYILSFNVCTNAWVSQYVYKRLRFLGNKHLSHVLALLFLAVWHGFHSGYYMSFLMEYLSITLETSVASVYKRICRTRIGHYFFNMPIVRWTLTILQYFYTNVAMGWCLIPFIYLSYDKWLPAFHRLDYFGFYVLLPWFVILVLIGLYRALAFLVKEFLIVLEM